MEQIKCNGFSRTAASGDGFCDACGKPKNWHRTGGTVKPPANLGIFWSMAMGVCIVIGLSSLVIGLLFSARTSKDPVSAALTSLPAPNAVVSVPNSPSQIAASDSVATIASSPPQTVTPDPVTTVAPQNPAPDLVSTVAPQQHEVQPSAPKSPMSQWGSLLHGGNVAYENGFDMIGMRSNFAEYTKFHEDNAKRNLDISIDMGGDEGVNWKAYVGTAMPETGGQIKYFFYPDRANQYDGVSISVPASDLTRSLKSGDEVLLLGTWRSDHAEITDVKLLTHQDNK